MNSFNILRQQLLCRLFGFVLCAGLICSPQADAAGELTWVRATAAENGMISAWYRCALPGGLLPADEVRLELAADVDCSVYVNGLRLLRFEQMQIEAGTVQGRVFNIRPLLREGRNLLAIELQGKRAQAAAGVGLEVIRDGRQRVAAGSWKQAPAAPPVGWQQTDFNDRDWKAVEAGAALPAGLSGVSIPEQSAVVSIQNDPRDSLPLELQDGDHVCIVGATFVERAQLSEHLETALSGTLGRRKVTFRNLGWSADTVWSESRGIFDAPAVGYLRMVEHIRAEEPTVVLVCLGQNEALTPGLSSDDYSSQLMKLVDELTASGMPVILVSPHELMDARPPVPSPSRFNPRVRVFSEATGSVAQSRQLAFVDLFTGFVNNVMALHETMNALQGTQIPADTLADNGMHLTARGYACAGLVLRERLLGVPAETAEIELDLSSRAVRGKGLEIADVRFDAAAGVVSFRAREASLSPLPVRMLVKGGRISGAADGSAWGVNPVSGAGAGVYAFESTGQYEALREEITKKNELYFHRWRPQNITYLFGFRKHEQGNNAADIARFDPFIRESEERIAELQVPDWAELQLRIDR